MRWWRYDQGTQRRVSEALARETWSEGQWDLWQRDRLETLLDRAATRVPFYRDQWEKRRAQGDLSPWTSLDNWPILRKEDLRKEPLRFIADDRNTRFMMKLGTSGSTGKPLTLWRSRSASVAWYSLFEARWRVWYGLSREDRWAIIGGKLVVPTSQVSPPFWIWNRGLNQLYMSAYHVSPENARAYVHALSDHAIKYVYGYPSSLHSLATEIVAQGLDAGGLDVVVSNAEPLHAYQRKAIQQAFECPVRNTYGMAEMAIAASECQVGEMHLWPDAGIVEVFDDEEDTPLAPGNTGRLICTSLINRDMPLIRYEVGDRGAVKPNETKCKCGRTLPRLSSIDGRMGDVVITPSGRRISRLGTAFKGSIAIREAQVIQEDLRHLRILVVPLPEFSRRQAQTIIGNIRDRVGGELEITLEVVEHIPRAPSGKFRSVINRVVPSSGESPESDKA